MTCWLNQEPNDVEDPTGIFVREQAKAMQRLGVEVAMLFPDLMPQLTAPFLFPKRRFDIEEGIPTFRLQQFYLPKWSLGLLNAFIEKSLTLYDDYFSVFGKPDLIHAHNYWAGFVALGIKEKYGIPFIFTEHDTVFLEGKFRTWLLPLLKKMLYESAANTAVSTGLKVALMPFCDKPIVVVPNIINTNAFVSKTYNLVEAEGKSMKPLQFVSVGNLESYKGYDLLLSAFAKFLNDNSLADVSLSIIGEGRLRKKLENQTRQLGVNQYVNFKGQLSREKVIRALRQADIFVSSSRYETFGVAMAEAMATGLPVLATPTDGAKDILREETGILTADFSVDALTEGLRKMYFEHQKFDSQRILQHVLSHFDETIVAKQYLDIYKKNVV